TRRRGPPSRTRGPLPGRAPPPGRRRSRDHPAAAFRATLQRRSRPRAGPQRCRGRDAAPSRLAEAACDALRGSIGHRPGKDGHPMTTAETPNGGVRPIEAASGGPDDTELVALLDEFAAAKRAGREPDLEAAAARHPELAGEIRSLWATAWVAEEMARSV